MDRNLFVIGDGTFKRGKPNKHGAIKFRCARHFTNNEWKLRQSRNNGDRCYGGFTTTLNSANVCCILHSCGTLIPLLLLVVNR